MLAIDVDYICFLALFISNKNTALNSIGRLNFNTSDIMLMAAYINFYYFRKWRRLKYLRFFFRNHFYFWYRSWHYLMHCPNTIYLITNELFFLQSELSIYSRLLLWIIQRKESISFCLTQVTLKSSRLPYWHIKYQWCFS